MATLKNTTINDTGFIRIPNGTTAQRPGSPAAGMIRFNTTFNITEYYNGTNWINLENGNVAGLDGSTEALAAPNAAAIKTLTGTNISGDYWIKPPGQTAYRIFCDMTTSVGGFTGGWMLVGVGREGRQGATVAGYNTWHLNAGNGDFATGLRSNNLGFSSVDVPFNNGIGTAQNFPTSNRNPRYMPRDWVRAACGGSAWTNVRMIINRPELGDSYYWTGQSGNFHWSDFNGNNSVDNSSTSATESATSVNCTRYFGPMCTGGVASSQGTITSWSDNDYGGANDWRRLFTWTWSGHSGAGGGGAGGTGQYSGFSTGSECHYPGFNANGTNQVNGEGHAIQFVHIFVRGA